ncbi:uncharacterized protein LOC110984335 isoform X2 [Acanthaster planci]|uniref:Uncharacterized protein LOC110984335 isoform X2 n=1 Tax=Acanthaster planci TaxID=133434 RepID=A0A8B7Z387_ACAPL|nr:uncharacterized protein LOC110984335 isoform X2 [Acanthaster planci]
MWSELANVACRTCTHFHWYDTSAAIMTECNRLKAALVLVLLSFHGMTVLGQHSCQLKCSNVGTCFSYGGVVADSAPVEECLCPENFAGLLCEEPASYIYLESTAYAVPEVEGEIVISVVRDGDVYRRSTVQLLTYALDAMSYVDFASHFELIIFEPFSEVQNVTLQITDDSTAESFETFGVSLHNPTNGSLQYPSDSAVVYILDDDARSFQVFPLQSTIRVPENIRVVEVDLLRSGRPNRVINITVSPLNESSYYRLAPKGDFAFLTGRMQVFQSDQYHLSILVEIHDDQLQQGTREFTIMYRLKQDGQNINGFVSIIIDDDDVARDLDQSPATPIQSTLLFFGHLPYITSEGDRLQIPIFRLGNLNLTSHIEIYTFNGTAEGDVDFSQTQEIIEMEPFVTNVTSIVPIIEDTLLETDETFYVTMSILEGGILGRPSEQTVTAIIRADPQAQATVQLVGASFTGQESQGVINIRVSRQGSLDDQVSVVVFTVGDTAQSSVDFIAMETVVIFPPQATEQTFEIEIIDDDLVEETESFQVRLGAVSQGMLGNPERAEIMIVDDDGAVFTTVSSTSYFSTVIPPQQDFIPYIIIAVAIIAALIFVAVIVVICFLRRGSREGPSLKVDEIPLDSKLSNVRSNSYLNRGSPVPVQRGEAVPQRDVNPHTKEYPREQLRFHEDIGSGNFATVFRAEAMGIHRPGVVSTVAVKVLKETASESDKSDFLKELALLKALDPHPNVMTLLACCTTIEPLYIILDFMPHGNLQGYLQRIRTGKEKDHPGYLDATQRVLQPEEVLKFACEICRGMEYLASKECIHRDLACRNILLSEDYVCKVSDFGLAREVAGDHQYEMKSKGRVPVRWLAPESLLHNLYTSQSDVWSFGVLMWELVTLGSHPYPGMSSQQVIAKVRQGYRLPKPEHCSQDIYEMMASCWTEDPEKRPTFQRLRFNFETMLSDAQGYLRMDGFREDEYVYISPGQVSDEETVL